jgi:ABC-2 type transport system ATP-binding protein
MSTPTPAGQRPGGTGTAYGADNLEVRFGRQRALAGVSLRVRPGSVSYVVGGDGAGKSTLLRALVGLVLPSAGTVSRPDRGAVGYLPAGTAVYQDLTVAENLRFVATGYHVTGADLAVRTADLLARTGLAQARDRLGRNLSGGMRQKLGVAMALLHRPALLVLDEPTTGVDPVSRAELARLVAHAAADGAAVVVATTYLDEAQRAAEVLVLDRGRQLLRGPVDKITAGCPGPVWRAGRRTGRSTWWRRVDGWRTWVPDGTAPDGATRVDADLEDAVMVAALAGEAHDTTPAPARPDPAARPGDGGSADSDGADRAVVRVRGVVKRFGRFTAVDHADLDLRPGEVVGLLGANGAGKTTLMRLLLGLLRADEGRAEVFGHTPSRATRRATGYLPQGLGLYTDLTVGQNLAFARAAYHLSAGGGDPVPDDLVAAGDVLVGELPLGLRRRAAFTAAMAHRPRLLVLDEPTSGVDPLGRARLWDGIRAAADAGAAVLVSTHYTEEAQNCDRLVMMTAGRVVATGTMADILAGRRAVEVDAPNWASVFGTLTAAGLAVSLRGTTLRVVGAEPAAVRRVLDDAGLTARADQVPATFDEAFVELSGGGAP